MRPFDGLARTGTLVIAGTVLILGLLFGGSRAAAQDVGNAPHPAHIHSGSCATLGDVVYPLTDVTAGGTMMGSPESGMMGTPASGMMASPTSEMMMATPTSDMMMASPTSEMMMGTSEASPAGPFGVMTETSETTVQAALSDLTAGGYAINVHESAANIGNYIACGDITDNVMSNGDVTIKLDTLNNSGYSGTATLHDNGDGTTMVSITLTHSGS